MSKIDNILLPVWRTISSLVTYWIFEIILDESAFKIDDLCDDLLYVDSCSFRIDLGNITKGIFLTISCE